MNKIKIVVLISGSGSNLQAIIDACSEENFPAHVVGVISNKPDVKGLERASNAQIPTRVLPHTLFADRPAFDRALQQGIDAFQPDLVVLAGFMRILTPEFVDHYTGRMLNIHPSLLPNYPGLHTHKRALDNGDHEHGTTVHFVTAQLDGGPPIVQAKVPILEGDNETSLASRVLKEEHRIYPKAIEWFAEGRLKLDGHRSLLDNQVLPDNGLII